MTSPAVIATLLWIDTAGPWCSVAVVRGTGVPAQRQSSVGRGQGEMLFDQIEAALAAAQVTLEQVDAVAVCTGPGGYAGLRVGIAASQGLASGRGKPCIGVPRPAGAEPDRPVNPSLAASEALRLLRAGVVGAGPLYPAPPDAEVSTRAKVPLID